MFFNAEKEHTPGFELSTFGFRVQSPTTVPLSFFITKGSSLNINLRMNSTINQNVIAGAFHSHVIY